MDIDVHLGEVDADAVKTRSVKGIVTLISRSAVNRIISTAGFFFLSVYLGRPEIGLFIAVNDLVSILGYFSDIGLAASLIQKKSQPTATDLRSVFTLQQVLVILLLALTLILTPRIFGFYHISSSGQWLFYSLLTAFFLASLKTIPSVILERRLRFEILAAVEIGENLIFYGLAVWLATTGAGVAAFAWAVLARSLVGTALIYRLSPWPIGLSFSISHLKSLFTFGVPYQVNSLLAVAKDRLVNLVLWKIVGSDGIGILGWAQNWSQLPLRFVMDNVSKVTFPAYSRLQDQPEKLKKAIEKTLFFISLLSFPAIAGIAVSAPYLIKLIPRYAKWEPALFPLALYCFSALWAAISTPLTNVLNAVGQVKTNTYLMIMWTGLTWAMAPALAARFGYTGVAYSAVLISFSSLVPIIIVYRLIHFDLTKSFLKPLLATVIMTVVASAMFSLLPPTIYHLPTTIVVSALAYFLICLLLIGRDLLADVEKFYAVWRHR